MQYAKLNLKKKNTNKVIINCEILQVVKLENTESSLRKFFI